MRLRLTPPVSAVMNRFYFRFVLETFKAAW
jgi:hypothetical protein